MPKGTAAGYPRSSDEQSTISVQIEGVEDIVAARQHGRELARASGFSSSEATLIATAISELVRNIVNYATTGEVRIESVNSAEHRGIVITARDEGPGIQDVQRALAGGYSTSGGLGLGLSGVRNMMDEFEVDSRLDEYTVVVARKWLR